MSYILDALNKAERDRKRGQLPSIESPDLSPTAHKPRNPWLWVAAFAVVFNAVLAGLLVYSSSNRPKEIESAREIVGRVITPTPPISADAAPTAEAAELPIHRAIAPVNTPALPLMTDQELQAQARELAMEAAAELPVQPEPIEQKSALLPPISTTTRVDDTPLEMIPLLVEKPLALQQAVPPFRVDVHVYAAEVANRFVMVDLKRYREGDDIAEGLRLERITKEGMVLVFRGERFRFLMKT